MEAERLMLAIIYSDGSQECERAVSLVTALHADIKVYRLNQHFTERAFKAEFGEDATYPQVNIGFKHIGDMKETLQFMKGEGMFI